MKPCETPVSTVYSCEELPAETTLGHLVLLNDKIRPNTELEIPEDLCLWRRSTYQSLDISNATTAPLASEELASLKPLVIQLNKKTLILLTLLFKYLFFTKNLHYSYVLLLDISSIIT